MKPFLKYSAIGVFILTLAWRFLFVFSNKDLSLREKHQIQDRASYFEWIPIHRFSSFRLPILTIEIAGKTLLVGLDLGLSGEASIAQNILSEIDKKEFLQSHTTYGLRGTKYSTNIYKLPEIRIGGKVFLNSRVEEENIKFLEDATVISASDDVEYEQMQIEGRLGWEIFQPTNLFLDLRNCKMAFCDSCVSLRREGYAIETFTKVPLLLDRREIEFTAITSNGPLRCLLDTGSTWNVLHTAPKNEETIEQMAQQEKVLIPGFQIGEIPLSNIAFKPLPVVLPIQIGAILGMDFFFEHQIFIDFTNSVIYISPSL